jgi:HPt (histidine-containing phosphotransfer) domain-containing protein
VIDKNIFHALKESTGDDFIVELIDTFLDDTPSQLEQLRTALAAQDAEAFRRAAHTIKSNAATFGANQLAALARELEMMGRENNLEAGNQLQALEEAAEQVMNELKSLR